ncbi:conserved Plasmodium protein, unknown function [Plasmodium relictum]|uniref:Uncharacterized protein n=1 Tax=Plasmodium relictum TaxID=85471 RepID=A0A1J1H710_PLARL|nr:conserved Plasmodium protein, unknown function [Plasmodium relictum]CRH00705.1 conserved Plasmodium protein, unknown function [Plasmodium relictum]
MNLKDLLHNEIIILKITEFLTIVEIQNLIISLRINVKTNFYFMRECLSLLYIQNVGKDICEFKNENDSNNISNIYDSNNMNDSNHIYDGNNIEAHESTNYSINDVEETNIITYDDENDEYLYDKDYGENILNKKDVDIMKNYVDDVNTPKNNENILFYFNGNIKERSNFYEINKKNYTAVQEITKDLNFYYEKDEYEDFYKYWLYIHLSNEIIDIEKELDTFFNIKKNMPVNRNNKLHFDVFQMFKFKGKYYSFFDVPWISIYFEFSLNAICCFCNVKVDENSTCIFSENFDLCVSNKKLLKYFNEINSDNYNNFNDNYENNFNSINNNEDYKHITKRRKCNSELYCEKIDNEFSIIRKTHIFCDDCVKLFDYRSNINTIFDAIKKDYDLLKQLNIINKTFKLPRSLFCICNYFFFKDKYITFFKKVSNNLQNNRRVLKKKLINNFIFSFSLNFYKFVIRSLLLCDDKEIFSQENIFLFGFYVKYINLLKLFSSPRIMHIYFSFNVIFEKIKKLQHFYKHKYFSRLSKVLHFDVIAIIEKLKCSKSKNIYKDLSKHIYNYLNEEILLKPSYDEIYKYFFQCVQKYKFS